MPPKVDENGYGLRVPALVISPYAKKGYIDHQTLSFDAYLKFIEDDFLGGQRIDPTTDGRPDPRPDRARERADPRRPERDFDFSQKPRPPADPATPSHSARLFGYLEWEAQRNRTRYFGRKRGAYATTCEPAVSDRSRRTIRLTAASEVRASTPGPYGSFRVGS